MTDPRARLEIESEVRWRGPFKWVALACTAMFLVAIAIFSVVSRLGTGEPAPPPGEEFLTGTLDGGVVLGDGDSVDLD